MEQKIQISNEQRATELHIMTVDQLPGNKLLYNVQCTYNPVLYNVHITLYCTMYI